MVQPYSYKPYSYRKTPQAYTPGFFDTEHQNIQRSIPFPSVSVNLRDFAIPTTTSGNDLASVLQSALDQTPPYGTLLLPDGLTLFVGTPLRITNPISCFGTGCTITPTVAMVDVFTINDVSDVTVQGLRVDCATLAKCAFTITSTVTSPEGLVFDNLMIKNTTGGFDATVAGIRSFATGGASSLFRVQDLSIRNCRFKDMDSMAFTMAYADWAEFVGNSVNGTGFHGGEFVGCRHVIGNGNRIRNCTESAIGVGGESEYFELNGNIIDNCNGDATITVESTSVYGEVCGNVASNCNTPGINVSFSVGGTGDNTRSQKVIVADNVLRAKAGVTTFMGINVYSTTAGGLPTGRAIEIHDNEIDGFNCGVDASWFAYGQIHHNTITNLTGLNTSVVKTEGCMTVEVEHNTSDTVTTDHAFQCKVAAAVQCDRMTIAGNEIPYADGKAFLSFEGTGVVALHDNSATDPASTMTNWLTVSDNATVGVYENVGAVSATIGGAGTPVVRKNVDNWAP